MVPCRDPRHVRRVEPSCPFMFADDRGKRAGAGRFLQEGSASLPIFMPAMPKWIMF